MAKRKRKFKTNRRSFTRKQDHLDRGLYGLSVPEAGRLIGIGRNASYEAAKRKQIPTIKIGGLRIVPKRKWLRMLGVMTK